MRSIGTAITLIAALICSGGCQKRPAAPVDLAGERLENPELGLAIAAVPPPFEAVATEGSTWTFEAPGPAGPGTLVLSVGPEEDGAINLVDSVKERKAWFEAAERGSYFGNRELGGPFGAIYTARGSYGVPGKEVEETWAYAIHPGRYRLLSVRFTYPTDESETRVEQLVEFLGEIESVE